jgi:hypothetical protein
VLLHLLAPIGIPALVCYHWRWKLEARAQRPAGTRLD